MFCMELSFKELKKREVVNVADGSSFGHINDLELSFPEGKLTAIIVPTKKSGGFLGIFLRGKLRIDEKNIIKIGGDAILVNVKCGEACSSSVNVNPLCPPPPRPPRQPCSPCSPCSPCPPPPPPPPPPRPRAEETFGESGQPLYDLGRIDTSDY